MLSRRLSICSVSPLFSVYMILKDSLLYEQMPQLYELVQYYYKSIKDVNSQFVMQVRSYLIFYFTSEIKAIFNKDHLNFLFIIYNHISKEVHVHCTFFKLSLFLALSLDNENESMLKGNQIKSS